MKKPILLAIALLAATAIYTSAADVKENWEKNCAKCHGADGKGDTKMGKKLEVEDYTNPKIQDKMKDEGMFKAIKEGVKEKDSDKMKMKPFGDVLTDDEIKALVAQIRSFKKK